MNPETEPLSPIPEFLIPKRKPPYGGSLTEFQIRNLPNSVLEGLASLEGRDLHSRDRDPLCRVPWVYAHASSTIRNLEGSEAGDRHGITTLELLGDERDESVERRGSSTLGDTCRIRDCVDEILLGHRIGGRRSKSSSVYGGEWLRQATNLARGWFLRLTSSPRLLKAKQTEYER